MVRHAKQKKLRAGRRVRGSGGTNTKKVLHRVKKVANAIVDQNVKKFWDMGKSPAANLESFGLTAEANDKPKKAKDALAGFAKIVDSIPTGTIKEINPKRRIMSEEDQLYAAKLLNKHGDNWQQMQRDIKTNDRQLSATQCKKLVSIFNSLQEDQKMVIS